MAFGTIKYSFAFVVVLVCFANGILSLLTVVTRTLPQPYIDEEFHIRQARHYCSYEFDKWDDKITTLPGLYFISLAILKPMEKALSLELCSVYGLRFVNAIGTVFNFLLFFAVQQKLAKNSVSKGDYTEVMSAVNLATFPPLFFFTFLYYTDVWSTSFVMLMYLLFLSKSPLLSALAGIGAVLMRQTNIIWVGMILILSAWKALVGDLEVHTFSDLMANVKNVKKPFVFRVLQQCAPYIAVCILFIGFVVINEGIVLGDRSAHVPVIHPMQNLYFLDIAAFFAVPYILFEIDEVPNFTFWPWIGSLFFLTGCLSEMNLIEHPYLLADNRHLSFYIWRRSFGNGILRQLVLPATYVLAGWVIRKLLRKQDLVFNLTVGFCIVLNLTPLYLFEIRYFIIPFIMLRLHFPQKRPAILLETIYFSAINVAVFYIFFRYRIYWESDPRTVQRIIW